MTTKEAVRPQPQQARTGEPKSDAALMRRQTDRYEGLDEDLQKLQQQIQEEEAELAQDRQAADARLQQEKQRLEQLAGQRRMKQETIPVEKRQVVSFEEQYRLLSEQENEAALEKLIRSRQRELRHERERIREQFQESLEALYNKAVDLHHAGLHAEAKRMFNEINIMAPGYKKTASYLAKLEEAPAQRVTNKYGQELIAPTSREFKVRDEMISNALDVLDSKL
jgi:chromosome segregation ATPase